MQQGAPQSHVEDQLAGSCQVEEVGRRVRRHGRISAVVAVCMSLSFKLPVLQRNLLRPHLEAGFPASWTHSRMQQKLQRESAEEVSPQALANSNTPFLGFGYQYELLAAPQPV